MLNRHPRILTVTTTEQAVLRTLSSQPAPRVPTPRTWRTRWIRALTRPWTTELIIKLLLAAAIMPRLWVLELLVALILQTRPTSLIRVWTRILITAVLAFSAASLRFGIWA